MIRYIIVLNEFQESSGTNLKSTIIKTFPAHLILLLGTDPGSGHEGKLQLGSSAPQVLQENQKTSVAAMPNSNIYRNIYPQFLGNWRFDTSETPIYF